MAERDVDLDHATLNRWVENYAGAIAEEAHRRKSQTGRSWRMEETYVKVKSKWAYLYRAIDKQGNTLDFMLSERRNEAAATAFFVKAIGNNGWPDKVAIDKSGSNTAASFRMNGSVENVGIAVPSGFNLVQLARLRKSVSGLRSWSVSQA